MLLTAETFIIADLNYAWLTLAASFFSTLFIYNASLIQVSLFEKSENGKTVQIEGRSWHVGICVISITLIFIILTRFKIEQVIIFTGTSLFSLLYMMPFNLNGVRLKGIRNNLILKNIILSVIWSVATVWFPLAGVQGWEMDHDLIFMFLRRFFFIYSLTIIYDIRDLKSDKTNGMVTIPLKFGIVGTRIWAFASLLLFCFFIYCDPYMSDPGVIHLSTALYLSALIAAFIIFSTQSKRRPAYYSFVVDGAMAIQFLLVLFFSLTR